MHEAIILAGGLGTRLRTVVSDVPKVMAPVAGKPFLHYIITKLIRENVSRIILAVGYKHESIEEFISKSNYNAEFIFSVENEPLGTGGGIKLALGKAFNENVFILNGDTYFDFKLEDLLRVHIENGSDISVALKCMYDFERYGTVELEGNRIVKFNEKKYNIEGLISAGTYIIKKNILDSLNLPEKFSMEIDVFEAHAHDLKIFGFPHDDYFIDIGIPEDFEKAQVDFSSTGN
jgi:D-glycero-alpha-D-manno-heptose 1-phosphate guanylyltransferase